MIRFQEIEYKHFGTCVLAGNDAVELIIPKNFGIRILGYRPCGGENLFFEQPADMTDLTTPEGWRIYGGHRLWVSPESETEYYPDNDPVEIIQNGDGVTIVQDKDPWTGLCKSMEVTFLGGARIRIRHVLKNLTDETMSIGSWSLTNVAPGGVETVTPDTGVDIWGPTFSLCYWSFTDLADPRLEITSDTIRVHQRPGDSNFKIGFSNTDGRYVYDRNGVRFVIESKVEKDKPYPEGGSCATTYICDHMLEMETLSPLAEVAPGMEVSHEEIWDMISL